MPLVLLAVVPLAAATTADLIGVLTRTPALWRLGAHLEIAGVALGTVALLLHGVSTGRRAAAHRTSVKRWLGSMAVAALGLVLFALAWWVRGDAAIPPDPALLLAEPIATALLLSGAWMGRVRPAHAPGPGRSEPAPAAGTSR